MPGARLLINANRYHALFSGSGDPILLLHGFSGDHRTWQHIRRELQASYSLIALDILGHGASDKPANTSAYRMEKVAADVIELLDQLRLGSVHLLGYSMGGRLALFLALHYGERFRSVMLESASPGLAKTEEREERHRRDNELAKKIEVNGIEWFVDFWENLPLWESQRSLPADMLRSQRQQRLHNDARGLANSLRAMGTGAQPSLWSLLPALELPTQLILGEHDHKFRSINQAMARRIPNAQFSIIPAAGHNSHLENPAGFLQQALSFLRSV